MCGSLLSEAGGHQQDLGYQSYPQHFSQLTQTLTARLIIQIHLQPLLQCSSTSLMLQDSSTLQHNWGELQVNGF